MRACGSTAKFIFSAWEIAHSLKNDPAFSHVSEREIERAVASEMDFAYRNTCRQFEYSATRDGYIVERNVMCYEPWYGFRRLLFRYTWWDPNETYRAMKEKYGVSCYMCGAAFDGKRWLAWEYQKYYSHNFPAPRFPQWPQHMNVCRKCAAQINWPMDKWVNKCAELPAEIAKRYVGWGACAVELERIKSLISDVRG